MSFSPCTKRSHAPYTAASFALLDTDSSRWTPVIGDRLWSTRRDGRHPRCPSAGTPRILHRPLATFVKIYSHIYPAARVLCKASKGQFRYSPFRLRVAQPDGRFARLDGASNSVRRLKNLRTQRPAGRPRIRGSYRALLSGAVFYMSDLVRAKNPLILANAVNLAKDRG